MNISRKLIPSFIALLLVLTVCCSKSNPQLERDLCHASFEGNLEKVKQLVEEGANVNTSVYKLNPLMLAILYAASAKDNTATLEKRNQRKIIVRYLLDNGASLKKMETGRSPLGFAKRVDTDKELEEILTNAGALVDKEEMKSILSAFDTETEATLFRSLYVIEENLPKE